MKRLLLSLLMLALLIMPAVTNASDISGADFYGKIRATNNGTTASNVCANVSINTTSLINSGILNATANNAIIQNTTGADAPSMPGYGTNPWIIFYDSISANASVDYTLYTNASNITSIYYFSAAAGMTTADDDADFEPDDNFTIVLTDWFLHDSGYLIYKEDAFWVYYDATAKNLTAALFIQPASTNDPASYWGLDDNAIDRDITTSASASSTGGTSEYLEFIPSAPVYINEIRFNVNRLDNGETCIVDIYYDGGWHSVYSANSYVDHTWTTVACSGGDYQVEKARVALYYISPYNPTIYEFDFGTLPITVTGVEGGKHTIIVSANTTDFMMSVE